MQPAQHSIPAEFTPPPRGHWSRFGHVSWPVAGMLWLLLAALIGMGVLRSGMITRTAAPSLGEVTIESTPQPILAAVYLAQQRGYFADEGLTVRLVDHPTGRQALATLIEKGSDFALCADTPFVRAYSGGAPLKALASLGTISHSIRIVGRRDRGITERPASLLDHRLGVVLGTNTEYVVYSACLLYGLPQDRITIVPLTPETLTTALTDGAVDAVAIWEPYASRAYAALGDQVAEVELSDFYRAMWLLVARSTHRDPRREQALLRALMRATAELAADPQRAFAPLNTAWGMSPDELRRVLPLTRYRVSLDQPLLLSLEAQRRWIGLQGPTIFEGLSPRSLSVVDPDAVDLIHPEVDQ